MEMEKLLKKKLLRDVGWIMYKVKKGTTLIESILCIALIMIITAILANIFISVNNIFIRCEESEMAENDINDLFINIERFLNEEGVQKINSKDNKLIIYKGTLDKEYEKEVINKEADKIIIKYYDIRDFEYYNTYNTLAKKIDKFDIKRKGKILYITVSKGGKEYVKAL
ncbi:hypothetical protein SAMN04487886_100155 [Clostridium sp. DSM 8431]|nr:hypothetical protein SAMN04487886_100155 [Clostridium sp. DSM 8431]